MDFIPYKAHECFDYLFYPIPMELVKKDIDDAIAISNSYKGFVSKLEAKGYYVSENEDAGLIIERDNSY